MTKFTRGSIRAEANEVALTDGELAMSFLAARSVFAEALSVGDAIFRARLLVNMKEDAIRAIVAFSMLRPEEADRHLREIVAMQEFTLAALLAERIEPMFADRSFDLNVHIRALVVAALALRVVAAYVVCMGREVSDLLLIKGRGGRSNAWKFV